MRRFHRLLLLPPDSRDPTCPEVLNYQELSFPRLIEQGFRYEKDCMSVVRRSYFVSRSLKPTTSATNLTCIGMETLEPIRNGTPEVSALCSTGPVRSKVLQTSNRAGISNGLERIRAYSAVAATKAGNTKRFNVKETRKRDSINTQSYFALRFLRKAKPLAYGQCRRKRFIILEAR